MSNFSVHVFGCCLLVGASLGVAAPILKLQRARIKTRVFSYFGEFKTFSKLF
jgi:hypothetical protein